MRLHGSLLSSEQVLVATRSHESFLYPAVLCGFFAVMAFSFASTVYSVTTFFGVLGYLCAAAFAWVTIKRLLCWWFTGYILTSQRLVIQRGVGRSVSIPLESIEGIDTRRSLLSQGGSAVLSVHSRGTVHVLRQVPQGARFSEEVRAAQGQHLATLPHPWGGNNFRY